MTDILRTKIADAHADEIADHDNYISLAELAEKEGCCTVAGILRDIAKDEKSHRDILEHILDKF